MNDYINAKLIADIASKPRLTALTLRALALRVIMLKELNEADVTDVEQELEIEEIMEFFDSHNLTISEHQDGTIVFHTKVEAPVISLRKTMVPHDVISEFIGGIWFDPQRDWAVVAESLASIDYNNLDDLAEAAREFVKDQKRFNHWLKSAKTMELFKPHFKA